MSKRLFSVGRCQRAVILAIVALSVVGCGGIEAEFDKAIRQLDGLKASLNHATTRFEIANKGWQATVEQLAEDFNKNNQELLGKTLRDTLEDVSSHTSAEVRADVDYVEAKVKALLSSVATAVVEAKKELEDGKKKVTDVDAARSLIAEVLQKVATTPVYLTPYISSFTPTEVGLNHTDHTSTAVVFPVSPVIKAHGWGFHQPLASKWKLTAFIRKADGSKETPLTPESGEITYSLTSNYLMQLTFALPSAFMGHHGDKLVIISDTEPSREHEIPIVIKTPEGPPPPPLVTELTGVRAVLSVTDDNKDEQDEVTLQWLANDVEVLSEAKGKGVSWDDWNENGGPYTYEGELKKAVPRGTKGRLIITKRPSGDGVSLRVEAYATDREGVEYNYTRDWAFHLEDEVQSVALDFTW